MIRQFEQIRQQERAVPPPVSSFHSSFNGYNSTAEGNDQAGGWAEFAADLLTMGLGWAVRNLGLTIKPELLGIASPQQESKDELPKMEEVTKHRSANEPNSLPNMQTAFGGRFSVPDERSVVQDQLQDLIPHGEPRSASETEEDSDAESFAKKYIGRGNDDVIENPVTVFGRGAVVTRSVGGRLHAQYPDKPRRSRRTGVPNTNRIIKKCGVPSKARLQTAIPKPDVPAHVNTVSNEVKYPTLPSISFTPPLDQPKVPETRRRIPKAIEYPGLPPVEPSTPAGYDPSYRMRYPDDTRFHHGSAGVDPIGAHARRITKGQAGTHSTAGKAVRRHHRIVSGSFGSFEVNKPSRLDERKYRLLQHAKKKNN
jgi:hypothetical protein